MLESAVWKNFKKAWPYYCERQEPGIGAGQPDVLLRDRNGMYGLVELKAPDKIALRVSQWVWHEQNQLAKGRSCVLTAVSAKNRVDYLVYDIRAAQRELVQVMLVGNSLVETSQTQNKRDVVLLLAHMLNLKV